MRRSLLRILPILAFAFFLPACSDDDDGGTGPESGQTVTVSMQDFSFSPQEVTVKVGDVVQWRNNGNVPHNSVSRTGAWQSQNLQPGQTFPHKFNQTGTFVYDCTLHEGMTGTIVVQ